MRVAVVGGGQRELEAARHLARLGHTVRSLGGGPGVVPPDLLADVDAVIGPVLGTDAAGRALYRPDPPGPLPVDGAWLDATPTGTPWLLGRCGGWLRATSATFGAWSCRWPPKGRW